MVCLHRKMHASRNFDLLHPGLKYATSEHTCCKSSSMTSSIVMMPSGFPSGTSGKFVFWGTALAVACTMCTTLHIIGWITPSHLSRTQVMPSNVLPAALACACQSRARRMHAKQYSSGVRAVLRIFGMDHNP